MLGSVLVWLVPAVGLCWFLGAYNRLVRLRSACVQHFSDVERELGTTCTWLHARLSDSTSADNQTRPGTLLDDAEVAWNRLAFSIAQLVNALAAARRAPLKKEQMQRVSHAFQVLQSACLRVNSDHVDEEQVGASAALGERFMSRIDQSVTSAQLRLNQSVARYNAAIDQFPASVVARITGLSPASGLELRGMESV